MARAGRESHPLMTTVVLYTAISYLDVFFSLSALGSPSSTSPRPINLGRIKRPFFS